MVNAAVNRNIEALFRKDSKTLYDTRQLDCLLNPKAYPPVIRLGPCDCQDGKGCADVCFYDALAMGKDGNIIISEDKCIGCGDCINKCGSGNLSDIKEVKPIFDIINENKAPVFAMIAPAYISQFKDLTPGKLRSAFKRLGFAGMIEVALFADILTLKEALEFDAAVRNKDDFVLTSCCCPMWVAMIKKVYTQLKHHMPPSVSPMVACGRAVKKLHHEAKTVFIGPCIAKKAEARQPDIADAVDFVLTFQEINDIFSAAKIDPSKLDDDMRDHSSAAGRGYAKTAGVSEAVKNTVERLMPLRPIPLKARQADGMAACRALLNDIKNHTANANFLEGMGCPGGCVGGPRVLIDARQGAKNVISYSAQAVNKTPVDNPYVLDLLHRLGFDTIESLTEGVNMFTRDFSDQE